MESSIFLGPRTSSRSVKVQSQKPAENTEVTIFSLTDTCACKIDVLISSPLLSKLQY